jgi:hypothetical protein
VCLQEAISLARRWSDVECAQYLARLGEVLIELGRLDEAEASVVEAVTLCRPFSHRRLLTLLSGLHAVIAWERGALEQARAFLEEALDSVREWGAELLEPFYRALRGAVLADGDDLQGAAADLDYTDAQLPRFANDPLIQMVASLCRGHFDLAEARACAARGETEASLRHRVQAEQRLERLAGLKHVFEDLVPMRRRLERALARTAGSAPLELVAAGEDARADALVVAEDGAWFCVPGGTRVDLSLRPNLQRVLVALTTRRVAARSEGLSLDTIIRSGWPGDRSRQSSARNRARVALARLRKLGLGALLLTKDGYMLDPDVPILIARSKDDVRRKA